MEMTGKPSIEIRKLSKKFGKFTALDDLDLTLEGVKCIGFLGPNGAGKTTTLKLLSDMIFPTEGECFINGISVQRERKLALSDVGLLIETPEIYPSLTPYEGLEMVADMRGIPANGRKDRIGEVLAEVKMEEWADKRIGEFSKGMKQRINIAAALVHDPEIVILDEPATGLDPRGMAEVREIVRNLKKRNRLIFMSSHILQEVTDVCDEIVLINKGKMLFYDTLENVTARFADGQASVDLGFSSQIRESVAASIKKLAGVISAQILDQKRIRVRFNGGNDIQEKLLEEIVKMHVGLVSFSESNGTLEEVYMKEIERGD